MKTATRGLVVGSGVFAVMLGAVDTANAAGKTVFREVKAAAFTGAWSCAKGQTMVEMETDTTTRVAFVRFRILAKGRTMLETVELPDRGGWTDFSACLPVKPASIRVEIRAYTENDREVGHRKIKPQKEPLYPC